MTQSKWLDAELKYDSGVFNKHRVVITRGLGAQVWDEHGRAYIDCMVGAGVANVGHSHPDVVKAVQDQAAKLMVLAQTLPNDRRSEFLGRGERRARVAGGITGSSAAAGEGCSQEGGRQGGGAETGGHAGDVVMSGGSVWTARIAYAWAPRRPRSTPRAAPAPGRWTMVVVSSCHRNVRTKRSAPACGVRSACGAMRGSVES